MSRGKNFTYQELAQHCSIKDLFCVIGDNVYDVSKFVDEHPGGVDVLLESAGKDATEAFEEVGHTDEARSMLSKFIVGVVKRQPGDPMPKAKKPASGSLEPPSSTTTSTADTSFSSRFAVIVGIVAFGAYWYLRNSSSNGGSKVESKF